MRHKGEVEQIKKFIYYSVPFNLGFVDTVL